MLFPARDSFSVVINKPFRYISKANLSYVNSYKEDIDPFEMLINKKDTAPFQAKKLDELDKEQDINTMALDEHLQVGNFGGFPSITIPNGFVSELPVGINITGNCYDDANVINIAYALESAMDYKGQIAKEVK